MLRVYDIVNILNTSTGISGVARRPRYAKQSTAEGLIGRMPKVGEQTIKVSVKPRLSVKQKPIDVDVTLNSNTTKKQLKSVDAPIAGSVLNSVNRKNSTYGKYYGYYGDN